MTKGEGLSEGEELAYTAGNHQEAVKMFVCKCLFLQNVLTANIHTKTLGQNSEKMFKMQMTCWLCLFKKQPFQMDVHNLSILCRFLTHFWKNWHNKPYDS